MINEENKKARIPFKELKLGTNYKSVKRESIDKLKESMIEEIKLHQDPQVVPLLVDIREDKYGTIIGGYHQYFAIKEIMEQGVRQPDGTTLGWPFGELVWIEPKRPVDDKHAKLLALKHNAQYDPPTKEQVAEWGVDLIDSGYEIDNLPILTDYKEITLTNAMETVGPEEKTKEERVIICPVCESEFTKSGVLKENTWPKPQDTTIQPQTPLEAPQATDQNIVTSL